MKSEKEIKNFICKTIAEATGTPIDFQEGHCANTACDSCIFNTLSKELYKKHRNEIQDKIQKFLEILLDNSYDCGDLIEIEYDKAKELLKEFLNNE